MKLKCYTRRDSLHLKEISKEVIEAGKDIKKNRMVNININMSIIMLNATGLAIKFQGRNCQTRIKRYLMYAVSSNIL